MYYVHPRVIHTIHTIYLSGCGLVTDFVSIVFFFQAEDGIRDAQESRGLGDCYKTTATQGLQVEPKHPLSSLQRNPPPDMLKLIPALIFLVQFGFFLLWGVSF